MASLWIILVNLVLFFVGCYARRSYLFPSVDHKSLKQPLQTSRPYNLAHRGSNGELPEETTGAYLRAIEEGADFIETDILSTKDGVLICHHDLILDETSDIAEHRVFERRKRTYQVQGVNITGFFTVDFTWKELQTLRSKQRFSFRDQQYDGKFPIITFEDYISIALKAARVVGIYPEIKNPVFINKHVKWPNGKKFEDVFVDTLKKHGYKGGRTEDTNQTYWEITSDKYFNYIKEYVVGIGPSKDALVPVANNYLEVPTDLVARAHAHNLQVHPYTFRNENQFLHFDFHQDPYIEYDFWINKIGVDGLFTDFAGSLHNFLQWTSPLSSSPGAR
uniref:glycerophosphodiester phosphodiesterase n=1 Tax=Opuntia streptacantha TaxID=393608 RepID=A0A7C8Z4C4_OPUST